MPEKPPYNPNNMVKSGVEYSQEPTQTKPKYDPSKMVKSGVEEVAVPFNKDWSSTDADKSNQLENTLNDIVKTSKRSISDGEKDILRDMLNNPNLTAEQAKESIQAMQGYHPKQKDNTLTTPDYYMKKEANGVLRPIPLGYGERPPKGYDVAKVWGTQKEADDDAWYTDMGKSLFNGAVGLVEGVIDLAQMGTMGITGEESENLRAAKQSTEGLKFAKDSDLDTPIFNTEGINKWSDLIDKDRYDLSPKALWGTMNMVAESAVGFLGGAGAASKAVQGITGAAKLGKAGAATSAFVGSYLTQVGEGLDAAREAGLTGRDAAAFSSVTTAAKAAIDAQFGLLPNMWKASFKASEKELLKKFATTIEKTAEGKITNESLKELGKAFSIDYAKMASIGVKEGLKNVAKEGLQEGSQDFIQKAAENLWDKMTPSDKAKFGTDALSPKSFGSYIQNVAAGLVGGVPMSIVYKDIKNKYNEQSINALDLMEDSYKDDGTLKKSSKDKIDEFKANVYHAARKGEITEEERSQALFKVDAYQKYNEQIKDLPFMDKKDKREAFELSFNIDALKDEILSKEDVSKLDPIGIAKVKTKEKLVDGLQKDLNSLLLRQTLQMETKAGQSNVDEVAKDIKEPEEGNEKKTLNQLLKELGSIKAEKVKGKVAFEETSAPNDKVDFEINNIRSMNRNPSSQFTTAGWNTVSETNPTRAKAIFQEELKSAPNNEKEVIIKSAKNGRLTIDIGDNKQIWFAQSVRPNDPNANIYINYDALPKTKVEVQDMGGATSGEGETEFYYQEPVVVKRLEFESEDKNGNPIIKAVLPIYNKETGQFIGFVKENKEGKSYYPSKSDQSNLKKIKESNWLKKDSMKGFEYVPKEQRQTKVKEVTPETKVKESAPEIMVEKPELNLNLMTSKRALNSSVNITKRLRGTNKTIESASKVKNEQKKIEKRFENLKKLLDCIHG